MPGAVRLNRPAVFLDRDGVVNASPAGRYVTSWKEFRFLPGTLPALKKLKKAGLTAVIVSNQAGVGKRLMTRKALNEITRKMRHRIRTSGGTIRAVYYCTHRPEAGCACRKPKSGMLRKAKRAHGLDLARSFVVGDHEKDIQMGRLAGCRTLLVLSGTTRRTAAQQMKTRPDQTVRNLKEAVDWILKQP